jgi:hypothetical protein
LDTTPELSHSLDKKLPSKSLEIKNILELSIIIGIIAILSYDDTNIFIYRIWI